MQLARFLFPLAAALCSFPAHAILIRADRDDAEYLEMATRYTSSVLLNAPDGEGVLIAPRWVLTAAHMAQALQKVKPLPALRFADRDYEIQEFFIYPDAARTVPPDIALILLRKEVRGIEPTPIYREQDEGGKAVVIVGHGDTGKIGEKPQPKQRWDRKKRAAINTVDHVAPLTLELEIRKPEDASDLQGAATPADGGGPAFIETAAGIFVAGICYLVRDTNGDGIPGNAGDRQLYVRASSFARWIDAVMLDVAKRELDSMLDAERR